MKRADIRPVFPVLLLASFLCCFCSRDFNNPLDIDAPNYAGVVARPVIWCDSVASIKDTLPFFGKCSYDSVNIERYEWDFDGDGTPDWNSSEPETTHHCFADTGVYTATFRYYDYCDCDRYRVATAKIRITNNAPRLSVVADSTVVLMDSLTFAASASDDGEIVYIQWDLNGDSVVDGSSSDTLSDIDHAYTQPSDGGDTVWYTAVFSAMDEDSNWTYDTTRIRVVQNIPQTQKDSSYGVLGDTTVIYASATDNGSILQYAWDIDSDTAFDTVTVDSFVKIVYQEPGEYYPIYKTMDNDSNWSAPETLLVEVVRYPLEVSDISYSQASSKDTILLVTSGRNINGDVAAYAWDFESDGTWDDTTQDSTYQYVFSDTGTFYVNTRVQDYSGNWSPVSQCTVQVVLYPPSLAAMRDTTLNVHDTARLRVSAVDYDGTVTHYAWDTDGNGTWDDTTTDSVHAHAYHDTGQHVPRVRCQDNDGNWSAVASLRVRVLEGPPVVLPMSDTTVNVRDTFLLWMGGGDPNGEVVDYAWDLEADGTWDDTTLSSIRVHSYTDTGMHRVGIRCRDNDGNWSATGYTDITVTLDPPRLYLPGDTTVRAHGEISLTVRATDPNGIIDSLMWRYSGGSAWDTVARNDTLAATITLSGSGRYSVVVRCVDDDGIADTESLTVYVNRRPYTPLILGYGNVDSFQVARPTQHWTCSDSEGQSLTYNVYAATIADSVTQGLAILAQGISDTLFTPSADMTPSVYYWLVVATDAMGDTSVSGLWQSVCTSMDLSLTSPTDSTWMSDSVVVIAGSVTGFNGGSVSIVNSDGNDTTVSSASFTVSFQLTQGENVIRVAGSSYCGTDTSYRVVTVLPNTSALEDVVVDTNVIQIEVWDNGVVDNDSISIKANGQFVAQNIRLVAVKQAYIINLHSGGNGIEIIALNQGTSGLNTAGVDISNVTSGSPSQTYSIAQGEGANFIINAP